MEKKLLSEINRIQELISNKKLLLEIGGGEFMKQISDDVLKPIFKNVFGKKSSTYLDDIIKNYKSADDVLKDENLLNDITSQLGKEFLKKTGKSTLSKADELMIRTGLLQRLASNKVTKGAFEDIIVAQSRTPISRLRSAAEASRNAVAEIRQSVSNAKNITPEVKQSIESSVNEVKNITKTQYL